MHVYIQVYIAMTSNVAQVWLQIQIVIHFV